MPISIPPLQFHDILEPEIGNQIEHMMRNHQRGRGAALLARKARDGAQRMTMQVIKMRVRDQNHVHRRQVAHVQSRLPDAFQQKQPAREVRIDDDVLSAQLQEETGVSDKREAEFAVGHELRFVSASRPRSDRRMPHQSRKLARPLA